MDLATVRNRMFTGFKPKEQDIETPYLDDLNGELKLVGLTGKERIALEEQASTKTTDEDGNAVSEVIRHKFFALALAHCLRLRSTGEAVFTAADVLGESGNGDGLANEMDSDPYMQLVKQVSQFVGKRSSKETKNDSKPTGDGSDTTSSPPASDEPLTNSSEASTQQS